MRMGWLAVGHRGGSEPDQRPGSRCFAVSPARARTERLQEADCVLRCQGAPRCSQQLRWTRPDPVASLGGPPPPLTPLPPLSSERELCLTPRPPHRHPPPEGPSAPDCPGRRR